MLQHNLTASRSAIVFLAWFSCVACEVQAQGNNPYANLLPPPALQPYPATDTPEPLLVENSVVTSPAPTAPSAPPPVAEEVATPDGEEVPVELDEPAEPEPRWYHITYWLNPPGWDSGIEMGLNGSSGTSDSLSFRTGGFLKRKSKNRKVDFDIYHNRTKAAGELTQNNARMSFRHDWLTVDPWSIYVQNQLYYDQFQAFDLNLNLNTGLSYQFLEKEWISLAGRFGGGASREFGGPEEKWVAEAQFGIDFEQKISETQKFYAKTDYFPEVEQFDHFRLLTDIGWEVELTVPSNVSLKFAATDRYDSHPNGVNPHNLNYSVLLLWKL